MSAIDGVDARIEALKAFEDDFLIFLGYSGAKVLNIDGQEILIGCNINDDLAVFVAVFERVVKHIAQNQLHLFTVCFEIEVFTKAVFNVKIEFYFNSHFAGYQTEGVDDGLDHIANVYLGNVGYHFTRLNFSRYKNIFQLKVEVESFAVDQGHHTDHFFPVVFLYRQNGLGQAQDGSKRVDNFVGNVGNKVALECLRFLKAFEIGRA